MLACVGKAGKPDGRCWRRIHDSQAPCSTYFSHQPGDPGFASCIARWVLSEPQRIKHIRRLGCTWKVTPPPQTGQRSALSSSSKQPVERARRISPCFTSQLSVWRGPFGEPQPGRSTVTAPGPPPKPQRQPRVMRGVVPNRIWPPQPDPVSPGPTGSGGPAPGDLSGVGGLREGRWHEVGRERGGKGRGNRTGRQPFPAHPSRASEGPTAPGVLPV